MIGVNSLGFTPSLRWLSPTHWARSEYSVFSARGFDQALSLDRACRELVINLIAWHEQAVMSIVPIDSRKKTAIKY